MVRLRRVLKEVWRFPYRLFLKSKLQNEKFSCISVNCIGGVLCHDLFQEFRSPTINLIIPEFVKFCENLDYYLKKEPIIPNTISNKHKWPEIYLDDLVVYGVHYHSSEELKNKWKLRVKRVNFDNILIIGTDNFVKPDELERFDALKYPKVLFTAKADKEYDWQIYLPEFQGENEIGDSLRYVNVMGTRIFEKHFDCVGWINESINYEP